MGKNSIKMPEDSDSEMEKLVGFPDLKNKQIIVCIPFTEREKQ